MTTYTFSTQAALGTFYGVSITWERLSYALGFFAIALIALYMFLLASTTMHVSMRKDLQIDIREAQGLIADLESEYLTQREVLTRQEAYARGFIDAPQPTFARRHAESPSVALSSTTIR